MFKQYGDLISLILKYLKHLMFLLVMLKSMDLNII